MKALFAAKVQGFRLPRYRELPNIGLYLEQITKYINGFLTPLGCPEITSSMVSNYVKKGVIAAPLKKQYSAEQIAYLIFISFGKSVLSLENISQLFRMQKAAYTPTAAYDYFCSELENMLLFVSGLQKSAVPAEPTDSAAKSMLHSAVTAMTHVIFINSCFEELKSDEAAKSGSEASAEETKNDKPKK